MAGIEIHRVTVDRGMVSQKAIEEMREVQGIGWITALKSGSIRALVEQGQLQLGLFDERNLLEISSPEYPGERLVACRNPQLAKLRAHKREELLLATEQSLGKIKARADAGKRSNAALTKASRHSIDDDPPRAQFLDFDSTSGWGNFSLMAPNSRATPEHDRRRGRPLRCRQPPRPRSAWPSPHRLR